MLVDKLADDHIFIRHDAFDSGYNFFALKVFGGNIGEVMVTRLRGKLRFGKFLILLKADAPTCFRVARLEVMPKVSEKGFHRCDAVEDPGA